ncbi:hypothetical protein BGP_4318 [Beggiatoa sp. PS]|nr:hypothetical protein BGP_4318 [Beggiatoa sp. PS]
MEYPQKKIIPLKNLMWRKKSYFLEEIGFINFDIWDNYFYGISS